MPEVGETHLQMIEALKNPPSKALICQPIEYIYCDHYRQRVLCSALDRVADEGKPGSKLALSILRFLESDFGVHVLDEEEDLFPLLRRRAQWEDRLEKVLGQLSAEHLADKEDCEQIQLLFRDGLKSSGDWKSLLRRFASNERHHLLLENAIVLPLARARLTESDLYSLGRRMAARRGIEYPGGDYAFRPS